jgi:hypothetical protein
MPKVHFLLEGFCRAATHAKNPGMCAKIADLSARIAESKFAARLRSSAIRNIQSALHLLLAISKLKRRPTSG